MINNVRVTPQFIYFEGAGNIADKLDAQKVQGGYRVPNNLGALRELYKYCPHPDLLEYGKKKRQARDKFIELKAKEDAEGDPRLRPYQRVDVAFLKKVPHAGIFNEQRTGKTPTTLILMKEMGFKRIGIVAPASYVTGWVRESEKWLGRTALVPMGTKRKKVMDELRQSDEFIFVVSYETMRRYIKEFNMQVDAFIVDEAHRLRGRDSKQTKAVKEFGWNYAKHRYALTGTPSVRAGDDIWSILNFLYPDRFKSYWQFVDRYMQTKTDWWTGNTVSTGKFKANRIQELQDILVVLSVNRKRLDVMKWLPPKEYITIELEADKKQMKAYEELDSMYELTNEDGEIVVDCPSDLARLTRLRQVCLDPKILNYDAPSAKTVWIKEWVKDNPEPVIIFSKFTSYLEQLDKELRADGHRVGMITGKVTGTKRQQVVDDFQAGKIDILLCNIIAAGVGLTLDRASVAIFADREWNPGDNAQAEDRIVPVSKERVHSMTIITLVMKNTIDEDVETLLQFKHSITEIVNSGGLKRLREIAKELRRNKDAQVQTMGDRSVDAGKLPSRIEEAV